MRGPHWGKWALVIASWIALYFGWREFWFLTDDSFIAFRYVRNSLLGHGYTWNPPPFRPVDGYTSWSWVVLLDLTWRITGVDPPRAANWLSLACGGISLALLTSIAWEMFASVRSTLGRALLVAFVLTGTLTNRTFLAWTSSGLETAAYGATVMWWLYEGRRVGKWELSRCLPWGLAAVAAAVTRPDALPLCGLTMVALVFLRLIAWVEGDSRRADTLTAAITLPGLLLGVFFLWKKLRYGSFLPNTYHAKVHEWWTEAGLRYLGAFVLEYALWIWLALVPFAAWKHWREGWRPSLPLWAAIMGLGYHVAYYTFVVGGDHFEFKAFYHLIPLLYLAFAWALVVLRFRGAWIVVCCCALLGVGAVIPWTHYLHTRKLNARHETHILRHPVAPELPKGIRWYGEWFDELESWLIEHHVGMRHQEHKVFGLHQQETLPPMEEGEAMNPADFPAHATGVVGVVGWRLPNAVVLDTLGLNDFVIARSGIKTKKRLMAHDGVPPPGYIDAFRPNVHFVHGHWEVTPRPVPLTPQEIQKIEREYRAQLPKKR